MNFTKVDRVTAATVPTVRVDRARVHSSIHAQLLRVTSGGGDADDVRANLRRVVKDTTAALAVLHLFTDNDGRITLCEANVEGCLPTGPITDQIIETASLSVGRNATQIKKAEEGERQVVCVPVQSSGARGEVLAAVLSKSLSNLQSVLFTLELASSYESLWGRGHVAAANQWKLNSLAAIVELVSRVEQQESFDAAISVATNSAAKFLGCARVAIAIVNAGGSICLRDVSGFDSLDQNSETSRAFREALAESQLHAGMVRWPAGESNRRSALLAHRSLAQLCHFQSICSAPLKTPEGEIVGAWLFADDGDAATGERFGNFVRAASPRIASALAVSRRSHESIFRRIVNGVHSAVRSHKVQIGAVASVTIGALMLMPIPYRVRCQCSVEPNSRRYAVAPFAGIIEESHVEPGDSVSAGELLAKMDGREILWDLSAANAERAQAAKQRDVELAEGNVTKVLISQLETKRLDARIRVLEHRRDNLELLAAIDGVILSGSLEKSQAAPVDVGQVLYEIGPLDDLRIEVEVPDVDVAQITAGQKVKVWIDGLESEPITSVIESIVPRSELRNDRNVFIAKLPIQKHQLPISPRHAWLGENNGAVKATCVESVSQAVGFRRVTVYMVVAR